MCRGLCVRGVGRGRGPGFGGGVGGHGEGGLNRRCPSRSRRASDRILVLRSGRGVVGSGSYAVEEERLSSLIV
jgi:hypothetical protein